jgi:hypothetical protein
VSRYRGLIAPGSDAGAWQVFHGGRTEYQLLEQALGERFGDAMEQGKQAVKERF